MAQNVKTLQGVAIASVKTVQGVAIANVKTIQGVDNTGGGGGALLTNLISYWKMDEASGTRADAHSTNDLTANGVGGIGATTGVINNAADFELDDTDFLTKTSNAALQTGNIDFTIQVWVKAESKPTSMQIMGKWASGQKEYTLFYISGSDRFEFFVSSDGSAQTSVAANNLGSPSTATWYCIHAWHDATNDQIGIAVNAGTADTSAYSSGVTAGTANLTFSQNDDGNNSYWDGPMDEAGFWKRVLTSQERTDLYNGGSGLSYDSF